MLSEDDCMPSFKNITKTKILNLAFSTRQPVSQIIAISHHWQNPILQVVLRRHIQPYHPDNQCHKPSSLSVIAKVRIFVIRRAIPSSSSSSLSSSTSSSSSSSSWSSPAVLFWQPQHEHKSVHFKSAFLQEQRMVVHPVLHLHSTHSSKDCGAGGRVIQTISSSSFVSVHPLPAGEGISTSAFKH